LVTDDGVPKLLDFGIAKLLKADDEAALTETMLRVMTPEYASPEQARGERMTTASDVYSLGIVLYELLTGQRPYRLKNRLPHEIAQIISERLPERPSTAVSRVEEVPEAASSTTTTQSTGKTGAGELAKLRRSLRGDLDNIVLMALRKDRARRYQSVEQFSEDIRRHLESLPVRARKDTFEYRASKFVQRNKLRVAAAAIIFVTLIAGVVATIREARIARDERARAERRFNDVRNLANSFIFEFDTELESLPGSTKARSLLVERAKGYLDSLAQEVSGDGLLQQELASAYIKVGDLQGRPYRFNLGQTGEALASYQKALAILEPLRHSGLPNLKLENDLATAYERIGTIQNRAGDKEASLENGRKAFEMRKALLIRDPANVSYRRQLADSYLYYGDALSNGPYVGTAIEGVRAALASQQKSLDMRLELAHEFPADAQAERDVAQAYTRVGFRLTALGANTNDKDYFRQSLECQRKALAIRVKMTVLYPDDARDRRNLGDQYMLCSEAQMANNDPVAALDGLHSSLVIFQKDAAADPSNAEARRDMSFVLDKIGIAQAQVGNRSSAEAYLREAFQIADQLNAADPANIEDLGTIMDTSSRLSELRERTGDFSGATEYLKAMADLFEKRLLVYPANTLMRYHLAETYASLGKACVKYARAPRESSTRQLQYWHEARNWYQRSLGIWEDLRNTHTLKESEADQPADLAREIAKCDIALSLRSIQK
jgi:non-specific serine/threonine protein kinase/serine/threonine-protein kinase